MKQKHWILGAVLVIALLTGAGTASAVDVATWADLQALTPTSGDTVNFTAATYTVTGQVELVSGVTYSSTVGSVIDGAGGRAFTAWGDRGLNDGAVDPPANDSAPKLWVIDGIAFQNCASDDVNRIYWPALIADLEDLSSDHDANGPVGTYNYAEAVEDNNNLTQAAFDAIDGDNNGELTPAELAAYVPPNAVENNDKSTNGGAISAFNGAQGTISNCTFTNCTASDSALDPTPDNDGSGQNNNKAGRGGAIYFAGSASTGSAIENCTFTGCRAEDDGGGIFLNGSSNINIYAITGCAFVDCSAWDRGGAIGANLTALTLSDSTFTGCDVDGFSLNLDGSNRLDNAQGEGGGLWAGGNDQVLTATNLTFTDCTSTDDAGGMKTEGNNSVSMFTNCTFTACITTDGIGTDGDDGGAAKHNGNNAKITYTDCLFTDNVSVDHAGAVFVDSRDITLTVTNCTFDGNVSGDKGGGINFQSNDGFLTVSDCVFTGNSASDDGGGILVNDKERPTVVIERTTFTGNWAGDDGGAIRTRSYWTTLTVTDCLFIGNGKDASGTPVGDRGAVFQQDKKESLISTWTNCVFADNSANASGGDRIFVARDATTLTNCTFVNNETEDRAIFRNDAVPYADVNQPGRTDADINVTTGGVFLNNCVFVGNTMFGHDELIDSNQSAFPATVTNNLFFGNVGETKTPPDIVDGNGTETGSVLADPNLDANHKPQAGSAAIDAGDPGTASAADIEGVARDFAPDIGAYEFLFSTIRSTPNPPIVEGDTVTLTAPVGTNYQWSKDGAPISGETSSTLVFDPVAFSDEGGYTVSYNDGTANVTTDAFIMTVNAPVAVPVAGLAGLIALAGACGLGGARLIRRRRN